MSYQTVRQAITSWVAQTPGFGPCYRGQPLTINPDAFDDGTGNYWPVTFVHMDHRVEHRIAPPAGGGSKQVDYKVGIVVIVRYIEPDDDPGDGWVDAVDGALTKLIDRIRADFQLGTAGSPIFLAGENDGDIEVMQDLPVRVNGVIEHRSVVQFNVQEIVQGI